MIDYGETKITYGAPEFQVGTLTQLLSLGYLAGFAVKFFRPDFSQTYLELNAASALNSWWVFLPGTGALVIPDGFSLVGAFVLTFLLFRPLELRHRSAFLALWYVPILIASLLFYGAGTTVSAQLWFLPFIAAATVWGRHQIHAQFTLGKYHIPQWLGYFGIPSVLIVFLVFKANILYAVCAAIAGLIGLHPGFTRKFFGEKSK